MGSTSSNTATLEQYEQIDQGISPGILNYCDKAIEIEMAGIKNSLNVAVAFGVIAYHFRNSLTEKFVRQ